MQSSMFSNNIVASHLNNLSPSKYLKKKKKPRYGHLTTACKSVQDMSETKSFEFLFLE